MKNKTNNSIEFRNLVKNTNRPENSDTKITTKEFWEEQAQICLDHARVGDDGEWISALKLSKEYESEIRIAWEGHDECLDFANEADQYIWAPKHEYVHLDKIKEIKVLNGADIDGAFDASRWDSKDIRIIKAIKKLAESISSNNLFAAPVGLKLPQDTSLFGVDYFRGDWLQLDVAGRVRVCKKLRKQGKIFQVPGQKPNHILVVDVTHLVFTNGLTNITDDTIESIFDRIVMFNVNVTKWNDWDFISRISQITTEPEQKKKWGYLESSMKKYHPELTNKIVAAAIIGKLTDDIKEKKIIGDDIYNNSFKRYSTEILNSINLIRKKHGTAGAKAMFLQVLADYFREAASKKCFKAVIYDNLNKPKVIRGKSQEKNCFEIIGDIYTDTHFMQFSDYLTYITERFIVQQPPKGGYAGAIGAARREVHEFIWHTFDEYLVDMEKTA